MNKRFENKLTAFEGLLALLQANLAKGSGITGFSDAVSNLNSLVTEIKVKSRNAEGATAGKTSVKNKAEDELIDLLLPVSSALYVFAKKQKNIELQEKTNITESFLRRLRDTDLVSKGTMIAELAAANSEGIAPLGITAEVTADLTAKVNAYSTALGARESSVAEGKGARMSVNELFAQADELLEDEIDRYMELLRRDETEFYNSYFAARVVKATGVRHTANGEQPTPPPQG